MTPTLPDAIPSWVPVCAGVWLLASTWRGWQRGLVRQAASLLGLAAAAVVGFWAGPILAPIVPAFGFPNFLRPILGGCAAGLVVWTGVNLVSSIVFRRTEDQSFGFIRLIYGMSGAVLGLLSGVALLGLAAWGVRFFGSFAEGLTKGETTALHARGKPATTTEPPALVAIKKVIEDSSVGVLLGRLDPLPPNLYPRMQKLGQVFTNPAAKERFLTDPEMESLGKNLKLQALKTDPELQQALHSGDVWAVLRNPKVQSAAADAQLLTALRTIDLDKLLDRAVYPVSGGPAGGLGGLPDKASPQSGPLRRLKP